MYIYIYIIGRALDGPRAGGGAPALAAQAPPTESKNDKTLTQHKTITANKET